MESYIGSCLSMYLVVHCKSPRKYLYIVENQPFCKYVLQNIHFGCLEKNIVI